LPESTQALMRRCFGEGHRDPPRRPTAHEWYRELSLAREQIRSCNANSQHWYSKHRSSCPWCERMRLGIPDPFPLHAPATTAKHALHPTTQLTPHPISLPTIRPAGVPSRPIIQPTPPTAYPTSNRPNTFVTSTQKQSSIQQYYPLSTNNLYKSHVSSVTANIATMVVEIFLSILGIFGVGWCLTGRLGRGIILILCSFLIYWPLMIFFFNRAGEYAFLLAFGAIILNSLLLINEISKRQ
jgi:hypothetical protein